MTPRGPSSWGPILRAREEAVMKALPRCWPVAQRDARRDHPSGSGWGLRLPEGLTDQELKGQVWRQLTATWSRLEAALPGHGALGTWRGDACAPAVFLHLFHPVARPAEPPSLLHMLYRRGHCYWAREGAPSQVMKPRGAAPVPAAGTPLFLRHSCLCRAPTCRPGPAVQI